MKKLSLFSLVFLVVAAIDSIRNLPAAAIFGPSLIFFFLFASIIFLFPISFIAAEFTSRYPEEGGVFYWVKKGMGEKWAVFATWLQWINTMAWYPTILSFIAGTFAYFVSPTLAANKVFMLTVVLTVFWSLTLINMKGLHISAKLNSFCGIIGLMVPMLILICLGSIWIFSGQPTSISFTKETMLPSLSQSRNWVSLVAIMASFLGMELAGVHVAHIAEPEKNFPKALGWSVFLILFTMILGSLSIAIVIPEKQIGLVDGVMQTFSLFFKAFDLEWFIPILTMMLIFGAVGSMINWLISPAQGILKIAEQGFLSPYFAKKNRTDVPYRILIGQALLVSAFCLLMVFIPSINAFYWFLTALSTSLYMIMYILLFISAIKLKRPKEAFTYQIPKGFRSILCFLGLSGCLLTIVVGFFLPDEIKISAGSYALMIFAGHVILILPALYLLYTKRRSSKL